MGPSYPISSASPALKALVETAEDAAKAKRHRLKWTWTTDRIYGAVAAGRCVVCGRGVIVHESIRAPGDVHQFGDALEVGCDHPVDVFRQNLEALAAVDMPETRRQITEYARNHGHQLGGWSDAGDYYSTRCLLCGGVVHVYPRKGYLKGSIYGLWRGDCHPRSEPLIEWRALQAARDLDVLEIWKEEIGDTWYVFVFNDGWFLPISEGRGPLEWSTTYIPTREAAPVKRMEVVPEKVQGKLKKEMARLRQLASNGGVK